jgi:hypothetical protein
MDRSDVVVIATPWPEFAELPLNGDGEGPIIIDCWGVFRSSDSGNVIRLGRALAQKSPSGAVA